MIPYGARLIVKRVDESTTTKSGFVIAEAQREKPNVAVVVAVGEDVKNIKTDNKVLFPKTAGYETEINGEPFLILNDYDIIAYEV
jgi:chaperonin GroES